MITLTTEQAQQIEVALDNVINDWVAPDDFPFEDGEMPALDGARNALATIRAARAHEQNPVAWYDKIKGMEVSVDVSTGEDDDYHRIFGRVDGVMLQSCGAQEDTILVIEDSRNFDAPQPVQQEPVACKSVPIEPTEDMLLAAELSQPRGYRELYVAMISAAPVQQAEQERETVVCESCGETIPECQIAGETESGGAACADCCVAFWIDRVAHLEEQHGINPAANQHPLIAYAESYEQMARVSSAKVDSLSVAIDIRQNMIPVTEDLNVLRTRNWTQEMSVAWHRAIPNLEKAFDDLIVAYNKGKK